MHSVPQVQCYKQIFTLAIDSHSWLHVIFLTFEMEVVKPSHPMESEFNWKEKSFDVFTIAVSNRKKKKAILNFFLIFLKSNTNRYSGVV